MRWIGWVEVAALGAVAYGYLAGHEAVMMVGVAVAAVTTLAFVPLLALARLELREAARRRQAEQACDGDDANGQERELRGRCRPAGRQGGLRCASLRCGLTGAAGE